MRAVAIPRLFDVRFATPAWQKGRRRVRHAGQKCRCWRQPSLVDEQGTLARVNRPLQAGVGDVKGDQGPALRPRGRVAKLTCRRLDPVIR